jgi:cellulose synthase/poly-beta-1,6-N-acetylglucosamine synthase-like glycosyltransferase
VESATPSHRPDWLRRAFVLDIVIGLLVVVGVLLALLLVVALVRGLVDAIRLGFQGAESAGIGISLLALTIGSLFFLYSLKFYLATLAMLVSSLVLANGNGRPNGNLSASGHAHPHGLMRFLRRGNGNGHRNGNGNGHVDLGYEPFVSIHIATYNEKRVIARLLEGCASLDYKNYEVVVVDDSADETVEILKAWTGRKPFKIVHRASRDGFKGGALQVALQHTDPKAEFVIVWDADVVPFADSIQTYLPHFFKVNGNGHDGGAKKGAINSRPELRPEVAAVQSYQWHVLNKSESWLTEGVRAEYAGSYMVERPFQEVIGSLKMVAGTAYMIRADVLREFGWGRSLTEDWELTLRLYARGFKVVYTPYAETPAECAATFSRLARQRMRWAEGHSYNVRRNFGAIMGSRRIGMREKVGFLFYTTYYLQSALFVLGSASWFVAEVLLRAHVPEWTATLGWSLLLTNLLSLPIMNLAGLLLEEAPVKDFAGVLGALATSFLLIPFQGYAAVKGLIEEDEGPWYRTPKTGRITDPVHHLRRLVWLRRWLRGPGPSSQRTDTTVKIVPARERRRPGSRLGWVVAGALGVALAGLGLGAINAPIANAASTSLFLHGAGPFTLDTTSPAGVLPQTMLLNVGNSRTWATTSSTAAAQTIFSTNAFTFNYWTLGIGGSANVTLTFAFSSSSTCSSPSNIAQTTTALAAGSGLSTAAFAPSSNVTVPAGSFFCFTIVVNSIGIVTLTLDYDATSSPTNLTSTEMIFIPELALPFVALALLAPIGARRLLSRRRRH